MRAATLVVCLLVLSAGCIVQTGGTGPDTATPSTPERIDEKAETPTQPTTPSAREYDVKVSVIEDLVHRKMNERRVEHDLEPLNRSKKLDGIARYKSWDMAERDYFAHTGPEGMTSAKLRKSFNSSCPNSGQNLHKRWIDASHVKIQKQLSNEGEIATQAVNALMNSTGHRQNILDPAYEVQGIGVFVDENGTVYLTQEFCG